MSITLLKQSFEIVERDFPNQKQNKKVSEANQIKPNIGKGKRHSTYPPSNGALKKIEAFDLELPETKKCLQPVQHEKDLKKRKLKKNVHRLLALSVNQNKLKVTDAEKMVRRAHKGRYMKVELPKVKQKSIFTEEDFKAFEEVYASL